MELNFRKEVFDLSEFVVEMLNVGDLFVADFVELDSLGRRNHMNI